MNIDQLWQFLAPVIVLIAFIVTGYILEIIIDLLFSKVAVRTKTEVDDIILKSLKRPIFYIFVIIGVYYAAKLLIYVTSDILSYVLTLSYLLIIIIVSWTAIKITIKLVKYYASVVPGLKTHVPLLQRALTATIAIIAILIILNALGINVTAVAAALGIGALAVALALQLILSEFFNGIYILGNRPIRVGDYIKLDSGHEGYVVDIGWHSTKIRELPNNIIIVPNSKIARSVITNYYLPEPEMACLVQVGVSYDSDLDHVERVTIDVGREVLKKVTGGVPEFDPFIRYHTFADFSINFTVILRVKEYVDRYLLTHEFIKALHKRYKAENIEIPFPIRTIQIQTRKS